MLGQPPEPGARRWSWQAQDQRPQVAGSSTGIAQDTRLDLALHWSWNKSQLLMRKPKFLRLSKCDLWGMCVIDRCRLDLCPQLSSGSVRSLVHDAEAHMRWVWSGLHRRKDSSSRRQLCTQGSGAQASLELCQPSE